MSRFQKEVKNTYVFHDPNKQEDTSKAIIEACMQKNIELLYNELKAELDRNDPNKTC